jgi:hypothetical protein
MNIYPNPAGDEVFIDYDLPASENGMITITDVYGKKINEFRFSQKVSESMKIDVSALQSGVYFISLQTGKYSVTRKMVKQ